MRPARRMAVGRFVISGDLSHLSSKQRFRAVTDGSAHWGGSPLRQYASCCRWREDYAVRCWCLPLLRFQSQTQGRFLPHVASVFVVCVAADHRRAAARQRRVRAPSSLAGVTSKNQNIPKAWRRRARTLRRADRSSSPCGGRGHGRKAAISRRLLLHRFGSLR